MTFEQIREIIEPYSNLESPSFIQGMLIGLLCGEGELKETVWIKKLIEEAGVKSVKESFLKGLHELYLETDKGLNGSGFELNLCLPDDTESLKYRAAMLGQLCEGILYGLGLIGAMQGAENELEPEVRELISDLSDIASIDSESLEGEEGEGDEQEADLVQLIEFVKIGVMTLNESLNPLEGSPIPIEDSMLERENSAPHTVH